MQSLPQNKGSISYCKVKSLRERCILRLNLYKMDMKEISKLGTTDKVKRMARTIGIFLLTYVLYPTAVLAQSFNGIKTIRECQTKECGWAEFIQMANEALTLLVFIAILGSTFVIVWAGFTMMINMGNPGEVEKGKKMLWTAIKGLIWTLCAWLLMRFIFDQPNVESWVRTYIN